MSNLVLVGVRGSGKSSAGSALASRLDLAFVDLDDEIEAQTGHCIPEIFAREGEAAFRRHEQRALEALACRNGMVLATGGGVVLLESNRERLARIGVVVWLRVGPEESVRRMQGRGLRPPLTDLDPLAEAKRLAEKRRSMYEGVADHVVDTAGRQAQEVCDELEQLWHAAAGHHLR